MIVLGKAPLATLEMLLLCKSIMITFAGRANSPAATDVMALDDKSRFASRVNPVIPDGTLVS